ncbi:CBP80/20-dependent translation initiation factor [Frankliniella fusca]|uniref:CBP80/20-dependent translation initiation factor n=1 Tax=Frankliniella fusca TaxID=407009 RepID=A0AAE1HZ25_9NEOP|nr:CBP80/20-dependent translation initiation factor [Frankliniella fusca]
MDLNKNRGSGLLRSPVSSPEKLPLPPVSVEGKARVDKLMEQVDSINITYDKLSVKSHDVLHTTWCKEANLDSDTLSYAVERLHIYWLSNRSAVSKAAIFLCANWMFEIEGQKLRNTLLLCLQKDFEKRQDVQANSPEQFLNAAAFLVEIYIRVRIEKQPLEILTVPVFQYLEDLLTGDDSEIELFAYLIINLGSTLYEAQAKEGKRTSLSLYSPLQNIFIKVRSTLMSRNLSCQSRLWLLFIMDVSSTGDYQSLSPSLEMFYKDEDHLGARADSLLKSLELINTPNEVVLEANQPKVVDTDVSKKMANIQISTRSKSKDESEKKTSVNLTKKSPEKNENFDKRENFRVAIDQAKGSKGKSYWLHDDRFDRIETGKDRSSETLTKPRASQGNWRRPITTKDDKDITHSSSDSNWRQTQVRKGDKDIQENIGSKPVESGTFSATVNGYQEEESWD